MTVFRRIAATLFLSSLISALCAVPAVAQPKAGHLDEVLRQMDAASLKFQSAEATFQWDLYEKVVQQTTTQKGTIYFKKDGAKTVMGARVTSPSTKILEYRNGVLTLFDPGTDHETIVTPKGNQAQMESFLTLGFGGSGKELAKAWCTNGQTGSSAQGSGGPKQLHTYDDLDRPNAGNRAEAKFLHAIRGLQDCGLYQYQVQPER
jgi:hypothetical protein